MYRQLLATMFVIPILDQGDGEKGLRSTSDYLGTFLVCFIPGDFESPLGKSELGLKSQGNTGSSFL